MRPRSENRILYVSDPSTVARTHLPDPVRETDIRGWIDAVADSGVDLFDQEVFSQGWTAWWRSERYQYDQRRQHEVFRVRDAHSSYGRLKSAYIVSYGLM